MLCKVKKMLLKINFPFKKWYNIVDIWEYNHESNKKYISFLYKLKKREKCIIFLSVIVSKKMNKKLSLNYQ